MTSEGACLGRDTLHQAAVTEEDVGVVVDEIEARLVVRASKVGLSDGKTDSVGDTLAEGTSGNLNAVGNTRLGVAWGDTAELTEALQVIDGDLVSQEVKEGVLEGTARAKRQTQRSHAIRVDLRVAVGEHKAVTVEPLGVFRVRVEEPAEKDVGDGGHAHGCTRVARVGLGDNVDREGTDGVDGDSVGIGGLEGRHLRIQRLASSKKLSAAGWPDTHDDSRRWGCGRVRAIAGVL